MNIESFKTGLLQKLQSLRYRRSFADANVGARIAVQLQALRKSRGLSQEKMAEETGIAQPRISVMEKTDYQNYNVKTLKRIAAYFDVALIVEFVSFKKLIDRIVEQSPDDMPPPSFKEVFKPASQDIDQMSPPVQPVTFQKRELSMKELSENGYSTIRFAPSIPIAGQSGVG